MAEEEPWTAQPRGNQFLQPQRGRGIAPREFGHEGNARLFDPVLDPCRVFDAQVHAARAVDGLPGLTSGQNRQGAIPLVGQDENGVDVLAAGEHAEAVDGRGAELAGHQVGAIRHLIENGPQLEPIREHPQGRSVAVLPEITQPD